MEYAIVSFRSRSETIGFYSLIKGNIASKIVNTPKEVGIGCGLSVKTSISYLNICKSVISRNNFKSFAGFFKISEKYNKTFITPIY